MMERMKESNKAYPQRRRTPSFSSTLLDIIYHSIDESKSNLDNGPLMNQTTHNSKHNNHVEKNVRKEKMNLHRAIMIEDWMERKNNTSRRSQFMNSTTTTSSSSETDTTYKPRHNKKRSEKKTNRESGFARTTKIRALKIYGEIINQKVKQPISPGSRIASFISSIFNNSTRNNNVKKTKKMCYFGDDAVEDLMSFEHKYSISKSSSSSPCFSSTTSSFSVRSCMNKTPGKSNNNGTKRCVRFYPFSVILGEEDYYSHHHNSVRKMTTSSSIKDIMKKDSEEKCVEAAAASSSCGFIKGYKNSCKGSSKFDFRSFYSNGEDDCDEDDDDALSYSSSDLFELDHVIGRYQEDLPVYETTNLETNKAIANSCYL
ncbi:hypothetical protein TanjilG_16695 [Lupinus angustifolius]|uniref:Protein BIG GRAIN 1-like A n=1 Tax=Lupinus angustifolius TaxID=3871 RepID=A0A4P1QZH0_LUPAN|nr:PREDICTED: protein BIG GRAIN 1-like C [Lupinus angustifolius]OIV98368.1 hypothetical protein TanjilG_16695 [Lupinus angustifolius]